jgi:hypothetical protein
MNAMKLGTRLAMSALVAVVCSSLVGVPAGAKSVSTAPVITPPAPGAPGNVLRSDGRIDQFQVAATPGELPHLALHVWYRRQLAPGGAYGAWTQVSGLSVNSRTPFVVAAEDGAGLISAFVDVYMGPNSRISQTTVDGPWTVESFDAVSPTWYGIPAVLRLGDGRLAYGHTTQHVAGHEVGVWYATQSTPGGSWGGWEYLGTGPFTVAVTNPYNLTQFGDGTVGMSAAMWGGPTCVAQVRQAAVGGPWVWSVDPTSPPACPVR